MDRRSLLWTVAGALAALAWPMGARASDDSSDSGNSSDGNSSDSGNSSDGNSSDSGNSSQSGDSTGNSSGDGGSSVGSAHSSDGSGASSNESADATIQSFDESGALGQSSEDSTRNSAEGTAGSSDSAGNGASSNSNAVVVSSLATTAVGFTIAAVVLVIVLVAAARRDVDTDEQGRPKRRHPEAKALLDACVVNARGDLGARVALLAASPGALDRLVAEARAGRGAELDALARAAGVSRERAATAVRSAWRPVRDEADAARLVLAMLADFAPDIAGDPRVLADLLWSLRMEQERGGDAAGRPAHARLARMLGITETDFAPIVASAVAGLTDRAALYADPDSAAGELTDALADAFGDRIDARVRALRAHARALGVVGEPRSEAG